MTQQTLPIAQFEHFCNVFLSELGFTQLKTEIDATRQNITGTGTIELGIIAHEFVFLANQDPEINDVAVASKIRKLADSKTNKGLIISTGKFSRVLKSEAKRKGELPIDLIDGENLKARLSKMNYKFLPNDGGNYVLYEKWLKHLRD